VKPILNTLLIATCINILLFAPGFALAQAPPPPAATMENSPETCSDGVDNDGDGYVDCADQDCARFPQCGGTGAPPPPPPPIVAPPPTYQPPPPTYQPPGQTYQPPGAPPPTYNPGAPTYQPPPPTYVAPSAPMTSNEPPPFGLPTGIIGGALVLSGLGMLGGSASYWTLADCHSGNYDPVTGLGSMGTCRNYSARDTAVVLDVLGGVFFVVGVVMTPIGFSQYGNYLRWKRTHKTAAMTFEPTLRADTRGGTAGFKLTF
jgi:hypothetical protein